MVYEIRKTNGNIFATVEDGTINDTIVPITFVGRRYPEYGLILNENDLHALENFANPTPPQNPIIGQLWYDTTSGLESLKVYTGGTLGWRTLGFSENFVDTEISGNLTFTGTTRFTNQSTFVGFTEFRTLTSFISPIQFTEDATFTGNILSEANITFEGDSIFNGPTTFNGGVSFGDTNIIDFDAEINFNNVIDFNNGVTVLDNNFTIQDNIDNSKQLKFELGNLSSVSTRVLNIPDVSGTVVLENNTTTLTNKLINTSNFDFKVKTLTNTDGSSSGDQLILVDTSVSPVTVTLSTSDAIIGRQIIIKDVGGNADSNNITIDTEGSELINGNASETVGTTGGFIKLISNGTNWFELSSQEPKDIDTASSNEVYVADGSGGGNWNQVTPANTVVIHSVSDLPAPVSNIITLAADTVYRFSGTVDIGTNRLLLSDNTCIEGECVYNDIIVSSTTGALLTSNGDTHNIRNIGFDCASGSWIDLNGAGTGVLIACLVFIYNCDTIGDIDAPDAIVLDTCQVIAAASGGLTMTGAGGFFKITNGRFTVTTGPIVDFGTSTWDRFFIGAAIFNNPAGQTGLDFAPNSANLNSPNGIGYVVDNFFLTPANAAVGYSAGDSGLVVRGNRGLSVNINHGQGYIDGNATDTTFGGTGAGNEVKANFGTSFVADIETGFSIDNTGRFTYNGRISSAFLIHASIFAETTGGAAIQFDYFIAKNGTIIDSSITKTELDGTNPDTFSCRSVVLLEDGDFIELWVRNETNTTALTLETVSIAATQLGV